MSFGGRTKVSRVAATLESISELVDWETLVEIVSVLDKSGTSKGGRPPISFEIKLRMLFLQHMFNLSDEELEDQVIDRLSFQRFAGLSFDEDIPDFTTIWKFKEGLIEKGLMGKIFFHIVSEIEKKGLILKKGTIVDATIIQSSNRPLSKKKREKLEEEPENQIDTDARSTAKNGKKHFGYKGHIGMDAGSKIIRKRSFTAANVHDSREFESVLSGDEQSVWGDKAYTRQSDKRVARKRGIHYGVLDKGTRSKKLSKKQEKRNRQKSRVRASVEHAFGYMRKKLKVTLATAKNKARNALKFDMWCIIYNESDRIFVKTEEIEAELCLKCRKSQ